MKTIWLPGSFLVVGSLLVLVNPAPAQEKKAYPTFGTIERADARLDRLIPRDATIEKLAEGFDWAEGPVWVRDGGYLLFSDVPRNTVFQWKEGQAVGVFLNPSGYTGKTPRGGEPGSNGLTLDPKGRLILCQHGDRRVARRESDGTMNTVADRYEGKRFNSPNDAVYKSNGDLYFTDPPYGLLKLNDDPQKELPFNGVYRVKPDGAVTLLTKEMTFPNGLAFSPDEKTLYVANSDPNKAIWMAFDLKDDGTLGKGRVFFDATRWAKAGKKGLPDGMKVDRAGNLFATGPGGVVVFDPDGTHLGTLNTGEPTANCGFGEDGSTLYITANMYLARVRLSTKGALAGSGGMNRTIWTVGHSTRALEAFVALLAESSIGLVADVRKFPGSRRYPQFNREELKVGLNRARISYLHLPALGGRRSRRAEGSPNTAWRVEAFNAFADHLATPEFEAGLSELIDRAEAAPTAIMCSEVLPWRCHRRLIADSLIVRGWTVRDIFATGKVEPHALTPFARVEGHRLTYPAEPLFSDEPSERT